MGFFAFAVGLVGVVSVVDGDTLEMHGKRIRLHGIDAPESRQMCERDGKPWRCGTDAANSLADFIGRQTVTCEKIDIDRYKRIVARCSVNGVEINAWLVEQGLALDYSRYSSGEYASQERRAREAHRGVWGSEFIPPWEWRRR